MKLKSNLGYIYYCFLCFFIQIASHRSNLQLTSQFDNKSHENLFVFFICLTICLSIVCFLLNLIDLSANQIENDSISLEIYTKRSKSVPILLLFDIFNSLLIFIIKLILNSQLIKSHVKDQSILFSFEIQKKKVKFVFCWDCVFESSIDLLIGNVLSRVESNETLNCSSELPLNVFNLCLLLFRFGFNYSNKFYLINKKISLLLSIENLLSICLIIELNSIFEIYFKQLYLINNSFNIYSYLLIFSLIFSIYFILLTNQSLFYSNIQIFYQKQQQFSNQVKKNQMFDSKLNVW